MHIKHVSLPVHFQRDVVRHQEELLGTAGLQAGQGAAQVPLALPEEPLPTQLHPRPCVPSLEPAAVTVAEAEVDPVDVRPMGLECFPPRPGGFRPLGFCMMVPLGGQRRVRAGHVLSAIVTHLWAENRRDHITASPDGRAPLAP